jgi:prepilin-type N-terminal cleavage/methylation domain-containing protein
MKSKGFTLIELMVVVVIIGILAAIAIPNFMSMRVRAKESAVQSNMHTLQLAGEDFSTMAEGMYPEALNTLVEDVLTQIGIVGVNNAHGLSDADPTATGTTVNNGTDADPVTALLPGNSTYRNPFVGAANSIDGTIGAQPDVATALAQPPNHVDNPGAAVSGEGTAYWVPIGTGGGIAMTGYVIFGDGDKDILTLRLTSGQ